VGQRGHGERPAAARLVLEKEDSISRTETYEEVDEEISEVFAKMAWQGGENIDQPASAEALSSRNPFGESLWSHKAEERGADRVANQWPETVFGCELDTDPDADLACYI
jgi:hypothetical protein